MFMFERKYLQWLLDQLDIVVNHQLTSIFGTRFCCTYNLRSEKTFSKSGINTSPSTGERELSQPYRIEILKT